MNNKFGIVEVGSTNTKGYIYENGNVFEQPFINIEFKKNYKSNGKLTEDDKNKLFSYINNLKNKAGMVYTYGTSIFRDINEEDRNNFITEFKENTGCEFSVVTSQQENEYTVYGAISNINYNGNIAVMIGGGGSTEIAICNNNNIIESVNTNFGVVDTFEKFSDLNDKYAKSNRDELVEFIKENLSKPNKKADILILAGGNHILCYESAKYPLSKNTLYNDDREPYMLTAKEKADYDLEYYYNIDLDEMRKYTPDNPNWWNGTRSMCSFAKCVADILEAKYIIPTSINMVYGIIDKILKSE